MRTPDENADRPASRSPRGAAAGGHLRRCRCSTMHSGIACVAAPCIWPPGARAEMSTYLCANPKNRDDERDAQQSRVPGILESIRGQDQVADGAFLKEGPGPSVERARDAIDNLHRHWNSAFIRIRNQLCHRSPGLRGLTHGISRGALFAPAAACRGYAALNGVMRLTLVPMARAASQRSTVRCALSQNAGVLPNRRESRSAISGDTARRSRSNSLMVWRDTPNALARLDTVRP